MERLQPHTLHGCSLVMPALPEHLSTGHQTTRNRDPGLRDGMDHSPGEVTGLAPDAGRLLLGFTP